jgi:outer membrane lipoprotein SlyB
MKLTLGAVFLSLCLASACADTHSASSFTSQEAMRAQPVAFGELISIRSIEIRPGQTRVGTATGAILGGIAGSQLGGGTAANVAGGVAGAVAGGVIGRNIQGSQVTPGVELTVTLESGETVAIVQPGSGHEFRVGDRVRVVGAAENARVVR